MELHMKKFKKLDGHNIKEKDNENQFEFNTEISFIVQELQKQISSGSIKNLCANLTSIVVKQKTKRNKAVKIVN